MSATFELAPDPEEYPDYYDAVQFPMDLETLRHRVQTFFYASMGEFVKDVLQLVRNAKKFNSNKSQAYVDAEYLRVFFEGKKAEVLERERVALLALEGQTHAHTQGGGGGGGEGGEDGGGSVASHDTHTRAKRRRLAAGGAAASSGGGGGEEGEATDPTAAATTTTTTTTTKDTKGKRKRQSGAAAGNVGGGSGSGRLTRASRQAQASSTTNTTNDEAQQQPRICCACPYTHTHPSTKPITVQGPVHFCRACVSRMPEAFLGKRVEVLWPDDDSWYAGKIEDFDVLSGEHRVWYDDGEWAFVRVEEQEMRFMEGIVVVEAEKEGVVEVF